MSDDLKEARQAARNEALEEAAKVADRIMEDYAEMTYSPHHDRMQNAAKTYCAGEIADAIRALKGQAPQSVPNLPKEEIVAAIRQARDTGFGKVDLDDWIAQTILEKLAGVALESELE